MRSEYFRYYAPVPCESEAGFEALSTEEKRKRVRRQRKERWRDLFTDCAERGEPIRMYA